MAQSSGRSTSTSGNWQGTRGGVLWWWWFRDSTTKGEGWISMSGLGWMVRAEPSTGNPHPSHSSCPNTNQAQITTTLRMTSPEHSPMPSLSPSKYRKSQRRTTETTKSTNKWKEGTSSSTPSTSLTNWPKRKSDPWIEGLASTIVCLRRWSKEATSASPSSPSWNPKMQGKITALTWRKSTMASTTLVIRPWIRMYRALSISRRPTSDPLISQTRKCSPNIGSSTMAISTRSRLK